MRENDELKSRLSSLESRVSDQENYSRRMNLRIDGLPEMLNESSEQTMLAVYRLFTDTMKVENANKILFDACHRVGQAAKSGSGRTVIVRFSWLPDRNKVWQAKKALKGSKAFLREDVFP